MPASLLAADPLLDTDDWWWQVLAIVAGKVLAIFVIGLVGTMFMVWFERKIVSGMQNRVGPNKAGPFGLLQTLADGTKLFFKEDLLPDKADKWVFRLSPFLAFVPAFLLWAVIPLGGDFTNGNDGTVTMFGYETRVQLVDVPIGILLVLALSSIGVYGIMLAGWASGSKYPLLGSVRATAQMISYEAALGLSLAAVLLMSGTLSTAGIVQGQDSLLDWNVVATGFIPFVVFLIAMTAELNRPPFDLVEAEQELVGGFNTEYSSIRFALFFLAEFMNVITMSAIMVTLFFGGPQPLKLGDLQLGGIIEDGNIFAWAGPLSGTIWVVLKTLAFLYAYVWFRATLPRLRYDQLMDFGWKLLIPIALGWFLVLAALEMVRDRYDGWEPLAITVVISLVVLGIAYGLFSLAMGVAKRNREQEGPAY
ncbi:NADH dehydrogenase subunit H [Ilumatobacter fluminis]|uniref:NADH-quinone oxidoreductase subunit H n=1 Tax=Ilumatobacter fluminis TaxID=467091 RepID=A0A4R7HW34_9ACTN|nr:NADH-quinone oxidoreductase subunit NuoH [Ilumatobacter fluminis]TDT15252.1 NADH dehydrogenase subunit H [Ilumatobacter fluminis]